MDVSEAAVKQRFAQLVHQSFPRSGTLQAYLAKSGETEADLLARIKVELLAARIAAAVSAGKSASQRSAMLAGFEHNFQTHWKSLTSCVAGYVMEDCKQYKGAPEPLVRTGASNTSSASSHTSTNSSSGSSSRSSASRSGG